MPKDLSSRISDKVRASVKKAQELQESRMPMTQIRAMMAAEAADKAEDEKRRAEGMPRTTRPMKWDPKDAEKQRELVAAFEQQRAKERAKREEAARMSGLATGFAAISGLGSKDVGARVGEDRFRDQYEGATGEAYEDVLGRARVRKSRKSKKGKKGGKKTRKSKTRRH